LIKYKGRYIDTLDLDSEPNWSCHSLSIALFACTLERISSYPKAMAADPPPYANVDIETLTDANLDIMLEGVLGTPAPAATGFSPSERVNGIKILYSRLHAYTLTLEQQTARQSQMLTFYQIQVNRAAAMLARLRHAYSGIDVLMGLMNTVVRNTLPPGTGLWYRVQIEHVRGIRSMLEEAIDEAIY
jgi:hypothetical protein